MSAIDECRRHGLLIGPNGGVLPHKYLQDNQSGAGNCVCGRQENHRMHV